MPVNNNTGVNNAGANYQPLPTDLAATKAQVQDAATKVLEQARASLTPMDNVGAKILNKIINFALPTLAAPAKGAVGAADIALQIGQLQDMLSQLTAASSKLQIDARMQEKFEAGTRELAKFEEGLTAMREAEAKQKEADKKGNVFDAISNWVQAAVSAVSIVFTLIAAVAQLAAGVLTLGAYAPGLVAGVALFASAAALGVQLGGQVALAIDSTMKACGEAGIMTDAQRETCMEVIKVAGYVSLACGAIGMVGGMAGALSSAAKEGLARGSAEGAKSGMRVLAEEAFAAAKEAVKATVDDMVSAAKAFYEQPLKVLGEALKSLADDIATAAKDAYTSIKSVNLSPVDAAKEAVKSMKLDTQINRLAEIAGKEGATKALMTPMKDVAANQGLAAAARASTLAATEAGREVVVGDLNLAASALTETSEQAKATQKKLAAAMEQLTSLIEQLQDSLTKTYEQMQATMSLIFGCVKDVADSMTILLQAKAN